MYDYKPLLGKDWVMNKDDCFTLAIDFYKPYGIEIPNFARPIDWNADNLDLISTLYPQTGFELRHDWRDLRPGDALATTFRTSVPNHLVIYVGDNKIIHHKYGMPSAEEELRPAWRMVTGYMLRHPAFPDLRPKLPDTTIEELLRGRH